MRTKSNRFSVAVPLGLVVALTISVNTQSAAMTLTGCLDEKGRLEKVAVGEAPTSPCDGKFSQVSWSVEGPQGPQGPPGPPGADADVTAVEQLIADLHPEDTIDCPCNILGAATWADWLGPDFFCTDEGEAGRIWSLTSFLGGRPTIFVTEDLLAPGGPLLQCQMKSHLSLGDSFVLTGPNQLDACVLEMNLLAEALGKLDGCSEP